jgi:hypothetical protein
MDKKEAKDILAKELELYRNRSYADLLYLLNTQDTMEVTGSSGVVYQLEFHAVWDSKKGGNLRVIGEIDDVGWRAFFFPLTDDFIIAQDGSFIGE